MVFVGIDSTLFWAGHWRSNPWTLDVESFFNPGSRGKWSKYIKVIIYLDHGWKLWHFAEWVKHGLKCWNTWTCAPSYKSSFASLATAIGRNLRFVDSRHDSGMSAFACHLRMSMYVNLSFSWEIAQITNTHLISHVDGILWFLIFW